MRGYSFGEARVLTKTTRNQLTHWTDARIIRAEIAEAGGRGVHRRFSFVNLAEVAVARELSSYGAPRGLLYKWVSSVKLAVREGKTFLRFKPDGRTETRTSETIQFKVRGERSALVVNLKGIVDDLSRATGEAPPDPRVWIRLSKEWAGAVEKDPGTVAGSKRRRR